MIEITQDPTVNMVKGRSGYVPEAIVLHTCEGVFQGCRDWTHNTASSASYHYIIKENSEVFQLVNTDDTAWHAGRINEATWKHLKPGVNPNLYTIGISCAGFAGEKRPARQLATLCLLVGQICAKYGIPMDGDHIVYHKEIAKDKADFGDLAFKPTLVELVNKLSVIL